MSRIQVDATLNTTQYNAGLAQMRKNADEFGKFSAQRFGPAFGKAGELLSRGMGPAAAAIAAVGAAVGAVKLAFEHLNEESDKFYAGQERFKSSAGVATFFKSLWSDVKGFAAYLASVATGITLMKESGLFDVFADEEKSAKSLADFKQRMKERDEARAKDKAEANKINAETAREAQKMSGNSAAEKAYNLELDISYLQKQIAAADTLTQKAKLQLELTKKLREHEAAKAYEAKYVTELFAKQNEEITKQTEKIDDNRNKVADALSSAQDRRAQASQPQAIASNRLSAGISVAGERVTYHYQEVTVRKLDTLIKHLQDVSTNTQKLKDLDSSELTIK